MNIRSQELLMLNKSMKKFNQNPLPPQTEETGVENPINKSSLIMNAMDIQGKNNIAFQGLMNKVNKKTATKILVAAAPLAVGMITTSCKPDQINIENTTNISVNFDAFTAYMQENNKLLEQLLNQEGANYEILMQMLGSINSTNNILYQLYQTGTLNLEQITKLRQDLCRYYLMIKSQLEQGQISDEEFYQDMRDFVRDLLLQYGLQGEELEDAFNEIINWLEHIGNTVDNIYEEVKSISQKMTMYHGQYLEYQHASLDMLVKLYKQGQIDHLMFNQLINGVNLANENLELLNQNVIELKNIFTNPESYQQFMNDLAELMPEDIDYQQIANMFEMLGLTMQDIANLSREQILAAIQNFQNTYVETEQQKQEIINDISQKLNVLQKLEHLNIPELTELLKNLEIAINNNSENFIDELQAIQGQLNTIMEKLDAIFSNLDKLVYFADEQSKNWDSALQLLGTNNALLQNIKANQAVTNEELAKLNENQQILINKQETSNSYLYLLNQKADEIEQLIKEFDPQGGMTVEEFKNALRELYPEFADDFEQFIKDYGFDDIPDHLLTLTQLVENIDKKLANQTDYSDKLDRLITIHEAMWAFIQNMDFSNSDHLKKLDKIIERLDQILEKLDCLCDEEDESVEDILNDLENMFPGAKRIISNGNGVNMDQVEKLKAQLEVVRNSVVTGYSKKDNAVKVNGFKY